MLRTCTRRLRFEAGHRVAGHENKCRVPHGHSFIAEVTAHGAIDSVGRVIDFSVLKARIGGWIDEHWDHAFLAWKEDHELVAAFRQVEGAKVFELPWNPTAENLSRYLLEVACPEQLAGTGVEVRRVRVRETENGWADAYL